MEFTMGNVKRIYVEKKEPFAVKAKELREEIDSYLGIKGIRNVRVFIRYDVENLSEETFEAACRMVFCTGRRSRFRREAGYSAWSSFRGSLTRGPIPPCSV